MEHPDIVSEVDIDIAEHYPEPEIDGHTIKLKAPRSHGFNRRYYDEYMEEYVDGVYRQLIGTGVSLDFSSQLRAIIKVRNDPFTKWDYFSIAGGHEVFYSDYEDVIQLPVLMHQNPNEHLHIDKGEYFADVYFDLAVKPIPNWNDI